jgi:heme/copper-type cytochrome/quinol oxidase subunit 3
MASDSARFPTDLPGDGADRGGGDPRGDDPLDHGPRQPSFQNAGTVGMLLFLASLSMLFTASLVGFIFIRYRGERSPAAGAIHLPGALWLSTFLVLGVSVALSLATRQIRAGKHRSYRKSLTAALALAAGFLTVQAPAMINLLVAHRTLRSQTAASHQLYGLIFFLVLLHALHVLGGMFSLVRVTIRALRGAYEREGGGHDPIRHTALYWHFLDVVWLIMFAVLYLMR